MASSGGDPVRGRTHRWTFSEGPTAGQTYEHTFHEDGTVSWRGIEGAGGEGKPRGKPNAGQPARAKEGKDESRAKYAALKAAEDVYAVSYLAGSGYTLTVVLSFKDHRMCGFASNEKEWYPLRGTFEVAR